MAAKLIKVRKFKDLLAYDEISTDGLDVTISMSGMVPACGDSPVARSLRYRDELGEISGTGQLFVLLAHSVWAG